MNQTQIIRQSIKNLPAECKEQKFQLQKVLADLQYLADSMTDEMFDTEEYQLTTK